MDIWKERNKDTREVFFKTQLPSFQDISALSPADSLCLRGDLEWDSETREIISLQLLNWSQLYIRASIWKQEKSKILDSPLEMSQNSYKDRKLSNF